MASLKERTISGVFWSFLQKVGSRGIQFIVTIILARLLTPADFGLIGMLAIFIALSQTLTQAGFSQALIQKKNTDEEDYSSVFWINLVVSSVLYGILYFCAPFIADFYHQPKLVNLTRVLSLVFVVNSFGYVQETRLKKQLDFKKLMWIHLPSTIFSGIVAVIMAYTGYGVWALVAQRLVMRIFFAGQLWIYSKWKPLLVFNGEKVKMLFSFGGNLMVAGTVQTIYKNVYKVVIGRFYPAKMLGYYENASTLATTPIDTISSVLSSVTFPAFSSIQDDDRRLKKGYRKTIQAVLFVICPLLILFGVLASPIFRFLLGEKWLPAVPFFQVLAIGYIFRPLNAFNIEMLNVKGKSRLFLKIDLFKKVLETLGIAICLMFYDIWALIWFQSLFTIGKYIINSYYSGIYVNYSTKEQLKDIIGIVIISIITGGMVFILTMVLFLGLSDLIKITLGFTFGIIFYYTVASSFKLCALQDSKLLIKSLIARIKGN